MKQFQKDDTWHILYESVGDFFQNTDLENPSPTMHPNNRDQFHELKGETGWRYGDDKRRSTFLDVRFDPSKGKTMCHDEVKKTMADKKYKDLIRQARTYRKRIQFEDHGFRLNVPKALSGEDRYFGVYKNARKPIVKIAINICGSASVDQSAFRRVAATAIPTIYAIEQAGICTEVWFCAFAKGTLKKIPYVATQVKLKSAQERFNWTTFAPVFCLGSYRESIFASWINTEHQVDSGLGRPMDDSQIRRFNNYGYTAVIGLNAVGAVSQVNSIFENLHKTQS